MADTPAVADPRHEAEVWRYDRLREAGYPPDDALSLARRADIDLHEAVELLEHGCPLELALRILL